MDAATFCHKASVGDLFHDAHGIEHLFCISDRRTDLAC